MVLLASAAAPARSMLGFSSAQGVRALEANGALDAAQLLHMTAGEVLSEVSRLLLSTPRVQGRTGTLRPTSSHKEPTCSAVSSPQQHRHQLAGDTWRLAGKQMPLRKRRQSRRSPKYRPSLMGRLQAYGRRQAPSTAASTSTSQVSRPHSIIMPCCLTQARVRQLT